MDMNNPECMDGHMSVCVQTCSKSLSRPRVVTRVRLHAGGSAKRFHLLTMDASRLFVLNRDFIIAVFRDLGNVPDNNNTVIILITSVAKR